MKYSLEEILKRQKIKSDAKKILVKYPLQSLGVALIYGALSMGFAYLQSVILAVSAEVSPARQIALQYGVAFFEILFLAPALIGAFEFFMNLAKDRRPKVGDVFLWYGEAKRAFRSVALYCFYYILMTFWSALFLAPAVAVYFFFPQFKTVLSDSYIFYTVLMALMLAGLSKAFTYTGAFYLLAEDPERKALACIRQSAKAMKPLRWEFFRFVLSFTLWFILTVFSAGVMLIIVLPYFLISLVLFFKSLFGEMPPPKGGPPSGA